MATVQFLVEPSTTNATRGVAFTVDVTALDSNGDIDTAYAGTVHFTSSDGAATLPGDDTLTAGEGEFNVTLNTNGGQTITVTDTATASITGNAPVIFVSDSRLTIPVSRSRITVDWVEEYGNDSQSSYNLSYDDSQISQEIIVSMDDLGQAVKDILGHHYRQGDSLIRVPPIQHALFPSMYAVKIARILPQGKPLSGGIKDSTIYNNYSRYEKARILIIYQNLPYNPYPSNIFPDVYGTEASRYCARYFTPTTENVAIRNGTPLLYFEGPTSGHPLPNDATPVRLVPKADIQLIWHNVPDNYLMNQSGIPVNIYGYPQVLIQGQALDGAVGKVNYSTFLGYPPNTLLLLPPRITPVLFPADYKEFRGRQESVRLWNVEFNFRYFNPPRDPNYPDFGFRGHNLAPHRDTPFWYGIFYSIGNVPYKPYRTYEFRNLFLAANAHVMFSNG